MTVQADMHTHTDYSDGSCSPAEVVRRAEKADLTHVAITDHDTVDGLLSVREVSDPDVKIIKGMELSCEEPRSHILGYGFDIENQKLRDRLRFYQDERTKRMKKMIKRINKRFDDEITLEQVKRRAKGGLLAKPHLAQALAEEGVVDTIREAFNKYLQRGEILDRVSRERFTVSEAVSVITKAGGIAVLAHPIFYPRPFHLVQKFVELGGSGLEVRYPDYTDEQESDYRQLARANDLVPTGGTDFHGAPVKPETEIGSVTVGGREIDALEAAVEGSPYLG